MIYVHEAAEVELTEPYVASHCELFVLVQLELTSRLVNT